MTDESDRPAQGRELKVSDDAIIEQAYIVARGVRPMALLGHVEADPDVMRRVSTRIESLGERGVVPFVWDRGDGFADVGYASTPWVADTYRWAIQGAEEPHLSRIVGLLLGYSVAAIREYESQQSRRWFADPLTSTGRVSRSPRYCTNGTEGTSPPCSEQSARGTRSRTDKSRTADRFLRFFRWLPW